MTVWDWNHAGGIKYLYLPDWLEKGVIAAFTTRTGGDSGDGYESLNLALQVGDDYQKVIANRLKVLNALGGSLDQMVCCQQVHGSRGIAVDSSYSGRGALQYEDALPGTDALVTDTPGIYLATFYADCVPVYIFDPENRCIALIHSGWKGTISHITLATIAIMREQYGSKLHHLAVFIGPGIDRCCFEIQPDLADRVRQELVGHNAILSQSGDKLFWDLKNTIRQDLLLSGVLAENIQVCELCTYCHSDFFYSHRRDNGNTGRMGAFVSLRV